MMMIGLTGGYASGKTEIAKIFKKRGAEIVSSDRIAHKVMLPGACAWNKIVEYFGEEILLKDKKINRKKLASIVFTDKNKLKQLNKFIHPAVKKEIKKIIHENKDTDKIIIFEVPLLFETGMQRWFNKIIAVVNKEEIQYKRAYKKSKISKEDFILRLKNQWTISKKEGMADFVIDNSGALRETKKRVNKIWTILTKTEHDKED